MGYGATGEETGAKGLFRGKGSARHCSGFEKLIVGMLTVDQHEMFGGKTVLDIEAEDRTYTSQIADRPSD